MAAQLLREFDLASPDTREQFIVGIAEHLGDDELRCFQNARRRLDHRFDILCGTSNVSGAQLPHEIQLQVVDLLGVTDIYYCTQVCRQWRCLLLQCGQLANDLLKNYFPGHFDKMDGEPEKLYHAIRKRHLRDSGRFRTRFTCGFLKNSNGVFAMDRVEGLQKGRTFKDLACSGPLHVLSPYSARSEHNSSSGAPTTPHERENAVCRYIYSDGRLAWQLMPAPGEWARSIIVHDFHAHRRWDLSLPSMRTKGIKLVLWALGNDLVVVRVVGERILYAWDLVTGAVHRVTLQTLPTKCFTRHHSVVIISQSGELLLWSFRHGLQDIDTTVPQDEDEDRGPRRKHVLKRALSRFHLNNLAVMFHPRDKEVFFLAMFDDMDPTIDDLWVCEFRNKRCCQMFTYNVPHERRLSVIFHPQMIDANGNYQLLEHEVETEIGVQLNGVTFNTISKSFGDSRFQAPKNTDSEGCLIWNDQLVLRYADRPEMPRLRPSPLLVIEPPPSPRSSGAVDAAPRDQLIEIAMESMVKSATLLGGAGSTLDDPSRRLHTMIGALDQGKPKYDIIRALVAPGSTSGLCAATGLRYMLLFFGGQCSWEGDHTGGCPREFGLPNPCGRAVEILGDDDFLVVVNRDFYTVFAVDEDGEIAEAMRDSATLGTEEL